MTEITKLIFRGILIVYPDWADDITTMVTDKGGRCSRTGLSFTTRVSFGIASDERRHYESNGGTASRQDYGPGKKDRAVVANRALGGAGRGHCSAPDRLLTGLLTLGLLTVISGVGNHVSAFFPDNCRDY